MVQEVADILGQLEAVSQVTLLSIAGIYRQFCGHQMALLVLVVDLANSVAS